MSSEREKALNRESTGKRKRGRREREREVELPEKKRKKESGSGIVLSNLNSFEGMD